MEFQPIQIGRSVSLAWGVFVLPRTKDRRPSPLLVPTR